MCLSRSGSTLVSMSEFVCWGRTAPWRLERSTIAAWPPHRFLGRPVGRGGMCDGNRSAAPPRPGHRGRVSTRDSAPISVADWPPPSPAHSLASLTVGSTVGEQRGAALSAERSRTDVKRLERTRADLRNAASAGQRDMPSLVHTEEVTGSIPVWPTVCFPWSDGLSMIFIGGLSVVLGSSWGAWSADHKPRSEEVARLFVLWWGFPARSSRRPVPSAVGVL